MAPLDQTRILSIQSHVVSGYVGNRAATFPLQMLGYDVDVVNTVQFSNHTGYGHTNGTKTSPEQLEAIFEGLWTNGLVSHARLLTGYIPGAEALRVIGKQVERMRQNEGLVYLLDPVMGDIGTGLYVSPDVVPVYKSLLKTATIITPNQFETELLSGVKIDSVASLHEALTALHVNYGVPHVVLSSIPLPIGLVSQLGLPPPPASYTRFVPDPKPPWYDAVGVGEPEDDILVCFASTWDGDKPQTYGFALPTIRGYFSGVGDLFSALVLGHYQRPGATQPGLSPLASAVSHALLTVQQILLRTHLYSLDVASSGSATPKPIHENTPHHDSVIPSDTELDNAPPLNPTDPKRKARRMRLREMRVVQERDLIVNGGETWPGKHLDWEKLRGD
ncbi:putative pyridoxal kinase [Vanrija albida]|uniref:pyridoxal kinase n=1 Tax=Vanrija albida TaxID=181172 RepID=A0ABR3Q9S7_9TREE